MRYAVVVDTIRTPIGRHRGALAPVRPDDLGAIVIRELVARTKLDPVLIDDVYWGAANQAGEDNRNAARMAVLLAGLPDSVPGTTVNRLCASGLEAVAISARMIEAGHGDVFIAGGCESMSRAPLVLPKPDEAFVRGNQTMYDTTLGWRMTNPKLAARYQPFSMGETAENVAERYRISREDQDAFALQSQQRAAAAINAGRLAEEIVPVEIDLGRGKKTIVSVDEHPRPETTLADLAKLKPAFREGGTVTAGNSSGLNDGAAGLLLMEAETAKRLGHKPLVVVRASASAGVDPSCMGLGPIPATKKALTRAGWSVGELDLIELNEAFAAQALACVRELGLDAAKVNVNGGAIALGHPLGCSGARLAGTLAREMVRRKARRGLATLCVGVGQGLSVLFERPE
ncbi:MAG: acetyl-CoA acetyltransferase [Phycisphaerae bacterium]|nr:MAG: acetyl-CoA C-acyltransferase [Planctomycetia bacterium]RIK69062.1 MAG: 3-oxoadipyl-CoA thiolase [Planctomycetota bacterium]GJQ27489.1 MAG: acetyl-CoA acetyltransferase [Phycisphaerae bacterium]